jgi:hypothetical protein
MTQQFIDDTEDRPWEDDGGIELDRAAYRHLIDGSPQSQEQSLNEIWGEEYHLAYPPEPIGFDDSTPIFEGDESILLCLISDKFNCDFIPF